MARVSASRRAKARPTPEAPIGGRLAAGAAWLIGARLATRGIDFLSLFVLAHALGPAEFGVVAIAMTLVSIVEAVTEIPVNGLLIRMDTIRRHHLDTAFTLSFARGAVLALTLMILAPAMAAIYRDDSLFLLVIVLGLAPALRGLQSPRLAEYARAINFWREFAIEFFAKSVSCAASIAIALATHSYWAIVAGIIATPAMMVVMSYSLAPYRPRLSLAAWHHFAHFMSTTTLGQLISALNWQCDRLLLGRFVDRTALGSFSLANDLSYLPEQSIIKPILRPFMSAFSHMKDDRARLARTYAKSSLSILSIGMPIMLGLALLASPAVRLCLGGKWIAAIPVLQWLPFSLIPPLFTCALGPLTLALGEMRLSVRVNMWEMLIKLPTMAAGAVLFGVPGVVAARLFSATATAWVAMTYVRRITGVPVSAQLAGTWRIVAAAAVMSLVVVALRPALDDLAGVELAIKLALVSVTGALAYIISSLVLWSQCGRPDGLESALAAKFAKQLRRPVPSN